MLLANVRFIVVLLGGALLAVVGTVLLGLLFQGIWVAVRAIGSWITGRPMIDDDADKAARMCRHATCRHANQAGARYCARCGRPLS